MYSAFTIIFDKIKNINAFLHLIIGFILINSIKEWRFFKVNANETLFHWIWILQIKMKPFFINNYRCLTLMLFIHSTLLVNYKKKKKKKCRWQVNKRYLSTSIIQNKLHNIQKQTNVYYILKSFQIFKCIFVVFNISISIFDD